MTLAVSAGGQKEPKLYRFFTEAQLFAPRALSSKQDLAAGQFRQAEKSKKVEQA
jgi:hypothetical protein